MWPLSGQKQAAFLVIPRVSSVLARDARSAPDQHKQFFTALFGTC
jgi:hypothetical protein